MFRQRINIIVCVGGFCSLLALTGCLTQDRVYQDLSETREQAYTTWLETHQSGAIPIPAEHLSLADAIQIALLYNKSLQAKIQEREVAQGKLLAAYRLALPRLEGSAYTAYGTREDDSAKLVLRQPLFRGGAATAGLRAAKLSKYWADEDVRATIQTVIHQVFTDYYGALLADNLCQVNRDAVRSAEAHLKDVQIKRVNGVASKYDELRAHVDVANFRAELIRQENNLILAKNSLLRTLGTATEADIHLSDALTHVVTSMSLEEAIATAYQQRPELRMAELNIRLQNEELRALRGSYLPEVDLALSAGTERWRNGDDRWRGNQRAALELNWTLLDGLGREGEIRAARARFKQREIELQRIEEDVFLDIQQARLSLKNAEQYVESQRLNLEHAAEGLRLAMTGYREGVNTEVEVVDARSALTEARGNYYRALYDHNMARLALTKATGTLEEHIAEVLPLLEAQVEPPAPLPEPNND